jgi:hypothetical protein
MALERIATVQAVVVGLLFAWAGAWKVAAPAARRSALKSALASIMGTSRRTLMAHFAEGVGELIVAALLLVTPWFWAGMRAATVFTLGFLGYLTLARRIAPERPCACMGGRATQSSRRSIVRALLLFALTLVGWGASEQWIPALVAAPWLALLILAEVFVLWLLSPDLGAPRVKLARGRVRDLIQTARVRLNPACIGNRPDWDTAEQQLRHADPFQQLADSLSGVTDRWQEGCWSFIAYAARYQGHPATAVFAFPTRYDARDVSAAVVDDTNNATVISLPALRGARPPEE